MRNTESSAIRIPNYSVHKILSEYLGSNEKTGRFYLSEYLASAGLTATALRSKLTGEHLKKLNVLYCNPSFLQEVELCCCFISSF